MMLYTGTDLENAKAQKVLKKMQKLKAINENAKVELICGNVLLGSLSHCVICTDESLTFYEVDGILPKISNHSYSAITGVSVSKQVHTDVDLSIGGAQNAKLQLYCSIDEGKKIAEFILSKIS